MSRIPLTQGAYEARSVIAQAQRCVNLYPESNTKAGDPPVAFTHYLTPGLTLRATAETEVWRGLWLASNNQLFGVCGVKVYYIDPSWNLALLGSIEASTNPVSMVDNTEKLVIVQGEAKSYQVDLTTHALTLLSDPNWPTPVSKVDYLDGFILMNEVGSQRYWSTLDNVLTVDPLYFASKTAQPDLLASIIVLHRELWLVGQRTTEIWYNAGNAAFPFAIIPGAFIQHGCIAKYSVCRHGLDVFWLSQDQDGRAIIVSGSNYNVNRISTHAIENAISSYADISDCIGMVRQQLGHIFVTFTFPSADATWVFDMSTGLWHEWVWIDTDGGEHRHRANCMASAYGKIVVGDWENGKLYTLEPDVYTDAGDPITRRRGFPHMVNDGNRASYDSFQADMDYGNQETTGDPDIMLRWSDDRGHSWGNPLIQSLGQTGEYRTMAQWSRLGMARDRVFELFWSADCKTAINGAWVIAQPWKS